MSSPNCVLPHLLKPTKSFAALNDDVLSQVASMLRTRDLLALMRTRRYLFAFGLPWLLRRPVRVFKASSLKAFHEFMQATPPSSFLYLRDLSLCLLDPGKATSQILDTLERATQLTSLCMSARVVRCLDTNASQVFRSLTQLRSLTVYNERMFGCPARIVIADDSRSDTDDPMLNAFSSKDSEGDRCLIVWESRPPALKELALLSVSFTASGTCYSGVTSLTCSPCYPPSLPLLVATFPDIEVLGLDCSAWDEPFGTDRHRQLNIDYQRQPECSIWGSLACLDVTYPVLQALNLQCAVSSVILDIEGYPYRDLDDVTRLLALMDPRHVRIRQSDLGLPAMQHSIPSFGSLKELRRFDVMTNLRTLDDDPFIVHMTPSKFADTLGDVAAATDIRMLDCLIVDIHRGDSWRLQPDMHDLARRINKSSNKLSYIKIQFITENAMQRYYGTVSRVDGEQRITEVTDLSTVSAIDVMYLPEQMPLAWRCQSYRRN